MKRTSAAVLACFLIPVAFSAEPWTPAPSATAGESGDNPEVTRVYREDQADRAPGATIDWSVVLPRDAARLQRVKRLYLAGALRTGADFYHVAMVLQHGGTAEDFLLAHELCIVAIMKGDQNGKWLAAASEDRFLATIGRPQRFGTQFRSGANGGPMRLYRTDDGVTDSLRHEFDVPPLSTAQEQDRAAAR